MIFSNLTAETVQSATLAFQCVNDIHGSHIVFPLGELNFPSTATEGFPYQFSSLPILNEPIASQGILLVLQRPSSLHIPTTFPILCFLSSVFEKSPLSKWLAPSKPLANPPVERHLANSCPPKPAVRMLRPLEESRNPIVIVPAPSLFVRFVATKSRLSF